MEIDIFVEYLPAAESLKASGMARCHAHCGKKFVGFNCYFPKYQDEKRGAKPMSVTLRSLADANVRCGAAI
jgi:hypothetical protein